MTERRSKSLLGIASLCIIQYMVFFTLSDKYSVNLLSMYLHDGTFKSFAELHFSCNNRPGTKVKLKLTQLPYYFNITSKRCTSTVKYFSEVASGNLKFYISQEFCKIPHTWNILVFFFNENNPWVGKGGEYPLLR